MQLYEKRISPAGKVSYVPHVITENIPIAPVCSEYTNGEIITWTASLVIIQIMILERLLPEHTKLARCGKLKAVELAVLDLVRGLGEPLDSGLIDYITDTWNLAMKMMQDGLVKNYENSLTK